MPEKTDTIRFPAVFGATGSLGRCACGVIESAGLGCAHLGGRHSHDILADLVSRLRPLTVSFAGEPSAMLMDAMVRTGARRVDTDAGALGDADGAIVVSAGIDAGGPMLAAIHAGIPVAAGNKEFLVAFGRVMLPGPGAGTIRPDIRPVDSEHSAAAFLLNRLPAGAAPDRLIITGTGGAVRDIEHRQRADLRPDRVLRHPVWKMGAKITVDSATLVNKALEVVEAGILFNLPPEKITVMFDTAAFVHAALESNNCVTAFTGPADMSEPVRMALGLPGSGSTILEDKAAAVAVAGLKTPDRDDARAIALGHGVLQAGGCSPMVLVLADEAAVQSFLAGRMRFGDIVPFIESCLDRFSIAAAMDPRSIDDLTRLRADVENFTQRV